MMIILDEKVSKDELEEEYGKLLEEQSAGIAVARMAIPAVETEREKKSRVEQEVTKHYMRKK